VQPEAGAHRRPLDVRALDRGRHGSRATAKGRLEFFTLSFEDGFVHVVCQDRVQPDEIVFLVDMILETLDVMPDVEPRHPSATI
jgi:hypothetical protein